MIAVVRWPAGLPTQLAESSVNQWLCAPTPMAATSARVPLVILETGQSALVSSKLPYEVICLLVSGPDYKELVVNLV